MAVAGSGNAVAVGEIRVDGSGCTGVTGVVESDSFCGGIVAVSLSPV
jgi:hypothetical protein